MSVTCAQDLSDSYSVRIPLSGSLSLRRVSTKRNGHRWIQIELSLLRVDSRWLCSSAGIRRHEQGRQLSLSL
ncbi:hypothetical protein AHF37_03634 [Paragonimus kellicotti]|nr:hypothetical protein AHF37_03634 [Paragonimus kellicotti]